MYYLVNSKKYSFSYTEMKELYDKYSKYSNKDFLENLPDIIHFSCIISYFKELNNEQTISDEGLIHQLVHLLTIPNEPLIEIKEIRNQFNELMRL